MTFLRQVLVTRATLVAFGGMGVVWGAYAALVPDVKAALGASDAAFGSLLLATPVAAVGAMLVAPRVAPLIGRHVLPLALAALAMAFMVPGWMTLPAAFAAAMILVGLTNGFLDVTMNARVSAIEVDRGLHLMNINHAAYSLAYAGAAVATGGLRVAGWSPGGIMTVMAVTILAASVLAIERGAGINGFARERGARVMLGAVPVWGGLIVLIAFTTENAAESWSALHIERTLGAERGEGSLGPALMALTMGLGRTLGQIVVARIDEARLMRLGTVVGAAGLALVGIAPTATIAYVGLVVTGLGAAVIAPTAFSFVGRLSNPAIRAKAIARATALGYLGYFFGPPALGLMAEVLGLRAAFVIMAVATLLVLALFPRLVASGYKSGSASAVPAAMP
jgi:MFS family permease